MSCGKLTAVTINVTSSCYTSVLTIPADQTLNGTTVMCGDGYTDVVVGNATLIIMSKLCVCCTCQYAAILFINFIGDTLQLYIMGIYPTYIKILRLRQAKHGSATPEQFASLTPLIDSNKTTFADD